LVLWGADGVMARRFDVAATWADRLSDLHAAPLPGGHFFAISTLTRPPGPFAAF
jgi:haloacetate dehalogenase